MDDAKKTKAEIKAEKHAHAMVLWREYKETGDPKVREEIILHYFPLVKYVAGRLKTTLPATVEQNDLVSYGVFGLIDAIEKFDLSRTIKFETYAIQRIKGAMIDELRSIDWIPRSVRSQVRDVDRARTTLEADLHRAPTNEELSEYMGATLQEVEAANSQAVLVNVAALEDLIGTDQGALSLVDTLEGNRSSDPTSTSEVAEIKELLASALAGLSDRDKTVAALYYYESLTLAQIGKVLGVTESRICQMHTKMVMQVRERLGDALA